MSNSKNAVLLHLFYPDMWEEIVKYLGNLTSIEYDLYVNLVEGYHNDDIKTKIINYNPNTVITISPNKGVDIGGFLFQYQKLTKDYDLILKLHTKKSLGLPEKPSDYVRVYGYDNALVKGNQWFVKLMDGVLKSKTQVNDIVDVLNIKEGIVGMVGLDRETYAGPNINYIKNLSNELSIPVEFNGDRISNGNFVGGTIFWVRNDILKKYLTKENIEKIINLLPDGYHNEPSYNHAFERMFGMMVYKEKMKIINI